MTEKTGLMVRSRSSCAGFLLLPFLLLFIGDFQLPIGESSITVPMGMAIIFPAVLLMSFSGHLAISRAALLLIGALYCGAIGVLLTPLASFPRAAAGALPLLFAAMTIILYEKYPIPYETAIRYMLLGGSGLAVAVIVLFLSSIGVSDDYYTRKLVIETPLGRSNYLAAFLLFLFALSFSRNVFLSGLFLLAILCTMSRGGLLALLIFFIAIPFVRREKTWVIGVGVLVLFVAAISIAPTEMLQVASGIGGLDDGKLDSAFNRLNLWSFGTDIFRESAIFGVGPNTFRTFVEAAGDVEDVWGVHNSILLVLLNYGISGFVFYALYLWVVYKNICLAEKLDKTFFFIRVVFVVLLIFGMYEPLVGSAAFELLIALAFVLARSRLSMKIRESS